MDLLEEFQALDEQPLAHLTFYVIDSHRPMHLANVFDDGRVYMFSDGTYHIRIHHDPTGIYVHRGP